MIDARSGRSSWITAITLFVLSLGGPNERESCALQVPTPPVDDSPAVDEKTVGESVVLPSKPEPANYSLANLSVDVRRIYFYESQAPKLVPTDFWPVSVDELDAALEQLKQDAKPRENRPYLSSALYVATYENGMLVSDADISTLDIVNRDQTDGWLPLGGMNLAIESQASTGPRAQAARMVTDRNGQVGVLVTQDSRLRFGWSRRGTLGPNGAVEFDLKIPACGRTRLIVGLPINAVLRSLDGVVTSLPNPPPEARGVIGGRTSSNGEADRQDVFRGLVETQLNWYSIEAGGLNQVRLSVREPATDRPVEPTCLLRVLGLDIVARQAMLDWTARVVLDVPLGTTLPSITVVDGGRITSVRVDGAAMQWQQKIDRVGQVELSLLEREQPVPVRPSSLAREIEISGTAPLGETVSGLPWVRVGTGKVLLALAEAELQFRVGPELQVTQWSNKQGWRILKPESEPRLYRLSGRANLQPPSFRFETVRHVEPSYSVLRLSIADDTLQATWEANLAVEPDGPTPLDFQIQSGWEVDSIMIGGSNRLIDIRDTSTNRLTLWPEENEVSQNRMQLQISGHQPLLDNRNIDTIPATWFVRTDRLLIESYATVALPPDYEWRSGTVLRGRMLKWDDLPVIAQDLLGSPTAKNLSANNPTPKTVLLATDHGEIPKLGTIRPPAAFDVDMEVDLRLDNEYVIEHLNFAFKVPAGRLPSVRIHLGESIDRGPIEWTINQQESSGARETLTARRISAAEGENSDDEVWELEPVGGIRDGLKITGRRRHTIIAGAENDSNQAELTVPLPLLPVTPSLRRSQHRATVAVGPGLNVLESWGDIMRIPNPIDSNPEQWTLRYDAVDEVRLRLMISPPQDSPTIIWQQQLDILAGSAGDEILLDLNVEGQQQLTVVYESRLSFKSTDGTIIRKTDSEQDPGGLSRFTLKASEVGSRSIKIHFWRPSQGQHWIRGIEAPTIRILDGVVLRKKTMVWTAVDRVALATGAIAQPPQWMQGQASGVVNELAMNRRIWLIPASNALALGCGIAAMMFAIGWFSTRRKLLVAAVILFSAVAAGMVPTWRFGLIAFIVAPLLAAGLLGVALDQIQSLRKYSKQPAVIAGLVCCTFLMGLSRCTAQNVRTAQEIQPLPVMIPVQEDGSIAGDKVYVPKTLFDTLFLPKADEDISRSVDFQSADYAVRIDPSIGRGDNDVVSIEAVWKIEVEQALKPVRLPINPSLLERLEILVDGIPNVIRPQPDSAGEQVGIVVRPPKAGVNVFRGLLKPVVEKTVAGANRINPSIPAVARSTVTITCDVALVQLNLPKCLGRIVRLESGSRTTASLGPVDELEIIWQQRGLTGSDATSSLRRRWWVHVTEDSVCREMEIEVGQGVREGVIVDLVSDALSIPRLTTTDWSFVEGSDAEGRSRIRVASTLDSPGPIRLAWIDSTGSPMDAAVTLPDIRPLGQVGEIETWLATSIPDRWRLVSIESLPKPIVRSDLSQSSSSDGLTRAPPVASGDVQAPNEGYQLLESGQFKAVWAGVGGSIDMVRRYVKPGILVLRFAASSRPPHSAKIEHRITIQEDQMRLQFRAVIAATEENVLPHGIRLPIGIHVEEIRVNDVTIEKIEMTKAPSTEILLPPLDLGIPTTVTLKATMSLTEGEDFQPPRCVLAGVDRIDEYYTMSRTDGLRVIELQEPRGVEAYAGGVEYDLTAGIVPLQSWKVVDPPGSETVLDGRYQIKPVSDRVDCKLLTTLNWNDGEWGLDVVANFEEFSGLTDFLTFRIPSRWIKGLNVEPGTRWSTQPSLDREYHLLRILPPTTTVNRFIQNSDGTQRSGRPLTIRIQSRLDSADEGGISVPQVELLGGGQRDAYFAVPKRLTSSPIVWQIQNARPEPLPAPLREYGPSEASHVTYATISNVFSATLEPAVTGIDTARSPLLELDLFYPNQTTNASFALMRWTLLPGNRNHVRFTIPVDARLLGAWGGGGSLAIEEESDFESSRIVRIPLRLSRLADQLVLLIEFESGLPTTTATDPVAVPYPIDLPVNSTWITSYKALDTFTTNERSKSWYGRLSNWVFAKTATEANAKPSVSSIQMASAKAIMNVLDASVDAATERTLNEKRAWLRPWFARLNAVRQDDSDSQELNDWTTKYAQQVLGTESTSLSLQQNPSPNAGPGTWLLPPANWVPEGSVEIQHAEQRPLRFVPVSLVKQKSNMPDRGDYLRIACLAMLLILVLAGLYLFSTRLRILTYPATWLAGLVVAFAGLLPSATSIYLIALAITIPFVAIVVSRIRRTV